MSMDYHRNGVRERHYPGGLSGWVYGLIGLSIIAILALIAWLLMTERVNANQQAVVTSNGRETGVAGPGLHVALPWVDYHTFSINRKTMELVAGDPAQSNSKADYVDWAIKARTKDGIDLYSMLSTQWHVEPNCVGELYPRILNDEGVKEQIVKYQLRSVVPQILANYNAIDQYQGSITDISNEIEGVLREKLNAECVNLDSFELKRGDFADSYEGAIAKRAEQRELTEQAILAQQTADAEAERVRIETEGKTAAQKLQAETDRFVAQQQTDAVTYDLEQRAAALSENPELIEWEQTQAIRDAGAIYLPSGVLPITNIPAPAS